jgi:hypothetical protein
MEKIEHLPLHASFARAWPDLKTLIESSQ